MSRLRNLKDKLKSMYSKEALIGLGIGATIGGICLYAGNDSYPLKDLITYPLASGVIGWTMGNIVVEEKKMKRELDSYYQWLFKNK